jgi:flagellar biosynthetic protein FlhB
MSSGERTEAATPRRLEQLRGEGRVARSQDLTTAAALLGALLVLQAFGGQSVQRLGAYMQATWVDLSRPELTDTAVLEMGATVASVLLTVLAPLGLLAVLGVVVGMGQTKLLFSMQGIKPDFSRLNPLTGFKRLFSLQSVVQLVKELVKVAILGYVLHRAYTDSLPALLELASGDVRAAAARLGALALGLGMQVGAALLVLGILDYGYQRWDFIRNARMTKDELKEEFKSVEGDPRIKSRIRQLQRKLASRRMMQAVPTADVVVTNPTHFAVALSYRGDTMAAPEVVAKGADAVAARIRELARDHNVPIVENKPLAQALYRTVEVGRPIPVELFQAVAEVLAYIYALRGQTSAGGAR